LKRVLNFRTIWKKEKLVEENNQTRLGMLSRYEAAAPDFQEFLQSKVGQHWDVELFSRQRRVPRADSRGG